MVFVKNRDFFIFCFLCKMHREKLFGEVLEKNKDFLGYKSIDWKEPQKLYFLQRGKFMVFVKNWDFSSFCFYAKCNEKKWKKKWKKMKTFLTIRTSFLKMPQICILAKGLVLAICVKNWDFSIFCFYGKCIEKKCLVNF